MRKRARESSPLVTTEGSGSSNTSLAHSVLEGGGESCGVTDIEVMVRRSTIAPCISCVLCGCFLRDATTIPECLHSFCRECIVEKFECGNINSCPKCEIDLGCDPLKKLRLDHSLQSIKSMIFPAERHKVDKIAPLHPVELVLLQSSSPQAHTAVAPATGPITSSPHTAVAPATGPALLVPSADGVNRQGDSQREHTPLALNERERSVKEHRETIGGLGVEVCTPISVVAVHSEELKCEHYSLIDKQDITQERMEPPFSPCGTQGQSSQANAVPGDWAFPLSATLQNLDQNTTRILGRVETNSGGSQGLAGAARLREEFEKRRKAEEDPACVSNARVAERTVAHIEREGALEAENARLREELENERAEKAAAFERIRVLEEKLRTESEIAQKAEASQRQLFQNYKELESQISEKRWEHGALKYNFDMLEKTNTVLETQFDHLIKSLAEEKLIARAIIDEMTAKIAEEVARHAYELKKTEEAGAAIAFVMTTTKMAVLELQAEADALILWPFSPLQKTKKQIEAAETEQAKVATRETIKTMASIFERVQHAIEHAGLGKNLADVLKKLGFMIIQSLWAAVRKEWRCIVLRLVAEDVLTRVLHRCPEFPLSLLLEEDNRRALPIPDTKAVWNIAEELARQYFPRPTKPEGEDSASSSFSNWSDDLMASSSFNNRAAGC